MDRPWRYLVLTALLGLLASACTGGPAHHAGPSPSAPPPAPQHYTISVDGTSATVPLVSDAFYPSVFAVHPGDVVTFDEVWTGEIHTVTLGTLVNQAYAVPPSPSPSPSARSTPGTGVGGLPGVFPAGFPGGRGDAIPAAAQPCFLAAGVPPAAGACPQVPQPPFDGTQSFYSSGWLSQGQSFSVTMSATTPTGLYYVQDLAHPSMVADLVVEPLSVPIPSAASIAQEGTAALAKAVAQQQAAAAEAAAVTTTLVAGLTEAGATETFLATFGAPAVTITAGQGLAWNVYGEQAIAVGPPQNAFGLLTRSPDGSVHINTMATRPAGGSATPPTAALTRPTTVNGGAYGTSGFHNSGLLVSYPPGLITYTLRFTAPGTYTVRDLIYPSMTETVYVH